MNNQGKGQKETERLLKQWFDGNWEPTAWMLTAHKLHRGACLLFAAQDKAEALGPDFDDPFDLEMDQPGTLLYGYAIENALKAVLVQGGWTREKVENNNPWKRHLLGELLRQTGIAATETEKLILEILSAHIIWAGKYPGPFQFDSGNSSGFLLPRQYD